MSRRFTISFALLLTFLLSGAQSTFAQADATDPVPRLLANLKSDNVRVSASAARSLGVVFAPGRKPHPAHEEVVVALITKLESKLGGAVRRDSAWALGRIEAKEALDGLKVSLKDEDVEVAIASGEAVTRILPVDEARAYLKEQSVDASESLTAAVYTAMARICKAEDAEFLIAGLPSENWRTEQAAVEGLERSTRAGARLTPEDYTKVAGVLGNEIRNASGAAVHFFTHIRNDDSMAAALAAADAKGDGSKEDTTWRNRSNALSVIYHWGWPTSEPALPIVIRQLGDKTANVTNGARRIINQLKVDKYLSQNDLYPLMLTELEKAEDLGLRGGIMREWGNHVDRQYASRIAVVASSTLTQAIKEKDAWSARAYSITLLGESHYTGSMEEIAGCVSDDVPNVRNAAGRSLEQLAPLCTNEERAAVPPILQPLLDKPVDWRKTSVAARAVASFPSDEAITPLISLLSHSVINVRDASSHSLATIAASGNEELRSKIEPLLHAEVSKSKGSWQYGARVLGALENPKAVPLLTTILTEGDWRSQQAAALAVAQIADEKKVEDDALNKALVEAAQSEVIQVQDAANQALRAVSKPKS
jgi:HEAT repeat protein